MTSLLLRLRPLLALLTVVCSALLTSCETGADAQTTHVTAASIKAEEPGDYWVGRRYFKVDYKFWGWVRRPGQPWSTAQMIMMNEQGKLAPDREGGHLGSDNNYEYKLYGDFSGQKIYEPASNGIYPEFVLKRAELITAAPGNIYGVAGATDPTRRIIAHPR